MKKCWIVMLLALFLTGCAQTQMTFETVADAYVQSAAAVQREVLLEIPNEAAQPSMENGSEEKIYLCDGYTLSVYTMEAGDLNKTIQTVSGYSRDALTVIATQREEFTRYDFVWASAGEGGDQVGKAVILDDGSYHYVVACMAPEETAGQLTETWQKIFESFWLT